MALPILAGPIIVLAKRLLVTYTITVVVRKVAEHFGISESSVKQVLKDAGII